MNKKLKLALLLFALTFIVGTAFAATNGVLAFGGTVRINSATTIPTDMRMDFIFAEATNSCIHSTQCTNIRHYEIITENDRTFISFDLVVEEKCGSNFHRERLTASRCTGIEFTYVIENTGNVPVRSLEVNRIDEGSFYLGLSLSRQTPGVGTHPWADPVIRPGERMTGRVRVSPEVFHSYLDSQNEYTFVVQIEIPYTLAQ